jgi:hypothetical protein
MRQNFNRRARIHSSKDDKLELTFPFLFSFDLPTVTRQHLLGEVRERSEETIVMDRNPSNSIVTNSPNDHY